MKNFFNPYAPIGTTEREEIGISAFILVLLVWAGITGLDFIDPNKLPSPLAVIKAFGYLAYNDDHSILLSATLASMQRIGLAALFVIFIGVPFGVLLGASPKLSAFFSPLIDPFRSAPVVALLPLFVMWLGIGEEMKVAFLFTSAVVYVIPLVRDAMLGVPYTYWEGTRDLGATHVECILKGVLPIAAPRIFDACIVATSILWTYITVAEYVNADSGLGQVIQNARRFSAMDQVLAGIIVIIALALITVVLLTFIRRKVYFWDGVSR
jgi:ABC-type nitrate/sulfonate/bicarbonate transport system permease component